MTETDDWTAAWESFADGNARHLFIEGDTGRLSYAEVIELWSASAIFRSWFNQLLCRLPFPAMRWETPAVSGECMDRAFESVLFNSPELLTEPDPHTFADHFAGAGSPEVLTFKNLGGDATMVVPAPGEPLSAYPHLGAFVREAPEAQRDRLWRRVGEAMKQRVGSRPVWLNTAGTGVAWLHVRLDDRPKYYLHAPYRDAPWSDRNSDAFFGVVGRFVIVPAPRIGHNVGF